MEDELPPKIGAYLLGRQLGRGGMGVVYEAKHELLGRKAAVKLLHDRFAKRDEIIERFFNEARVASAINDPGIVQIFDFGLEDGNVFIVMELLDGEPLDLRLQRLTKLPWKDALRLTRQLALSLEAAHRNGVVHRDLKPENIIVVPDKEASSGERTKILDFGIAKLVDPEQKRNHTQTGMTIGTPMYMSPEQCRGSGKIDHRADIYSLGCVLYQLVTGEHVFKAEGAGELYVMHMMEQPEPPSARGVPLPHPVEALILKCLEKEPADRFQSMNDLAIEIDAALGRISEALTPLPKPLPRASTATAATMEAPAAAPAPAASTLQDPPRRSFRMLWLVAIAVLLAGGVTAFVLANLGHKRGTELPPDPVRIATPPTQPAIDAAISIDAAPQVVEEPPPVPVEPAQPAAKVKPKPKPKSKPSVPPATDQPAGKETPPTGSGSAQNYYEDR
ncbi:MAG: serine/threonine-protein kinase [Kofleriaceae bacterium]